MNIIETKNLGFRYKRQMVLSDVSLQVPKGAVYGYLGANGSGKTTTIRILLGLLGNNKNVVICGREMNSEKDKIAVYARVGSLISPFFMYEHLTVKEHFDCLKVLFGKDSFYVLQVIEQIGLMKHTGKKVKYLSSGMRQRLAIGMAIFNKPELLILDEPVNGLDPVGIFEMRELFLSLNKQGTTIFLSSHILSEVEKICTHIGILHEGKLLFQGAMDELIEQGGTLEDIYLNLIRRNYD